jgi:stage V sporulation protein R
MDNFTKYRQSFDNNYQKDARDIYDFVVNDLGLKPKDTDFIKADQSRILMLVAYLFPLALPHWSRGRDYIIAKKESKNSKIYEIVFNTTPSLAYILDTAKHGEIKFIIAHVYGHTHIYGNSIYENSDSDILQKLRYALDLYHEKESIYGMEHIDKFIEFVHSLRYIFSSKKFVKNYGFNFKKEEKDPILSKSILKNVYKNNLDNRQNIEDKDDDLFNYIINNSPLEDWEKYLAYVEKEFSDHVYERAKLKYVHEGFATWTHRKTFLKLFNEKDFFESLFLDIGIYPDIKNPYWFGSKILEALEDEGYNIPELVKTISDGELFYGYFSKDIWKRIVFEFKNEVSKEELNELYEKYEEIKNMFVKGYAYQQLPKIYIDNYPSLYQSKESWIVVNKILDDKDNKNFELKLTSDTPLDEAYAKGTVEHIANVWKGNVTLRYPNPQNKK